MTPARPNPTEGIMGNHHPTITRYTCAVCWHNGQGLRCTGDEVAVPLWTSLKEAYADPVHNDGCGIVELEITLKNVIIETSPTWCEVPQDE